ncbi:MAG: alpha/beta fold hydrolase [Saprospiraceae bacterium]|nr:alpha/beta fold hydrolase [Saprospiraceae bacterium]
MKKISQKIQLIALRQYANTLALFSELKAGEWAMKLFFTPRKGRLTDENRQTLRSATWETLQLRDVKIQTYRWEGKGETILLAHGWESNAARWQQLGKKLRKQGYTVVALDAPAHGESGSAQFNAFLYAEMIKTAVERFAPTTIIGHSVGAFATAFYATHFLHPSVKRLVLMAAPSELNQIFDKFLDFIRVSPKVRRGFYRKLELMFGHPIEYFSIKTLVQKLTINGLVIHDKTDDICKFEDGEQIHAHWQGSAFVATEGYGHTLRHENVQKIVMDYLQKELA